MSLVVVNRVALAGKTRLSPLTGATFPVQLALTLQLPLPFPPHALNRSSLEKLHAYPTKKSPTIRYLFSGISPVLGCLKLEFSCRSSGLLFQHSFQAFQPLVQLCYLRFRPLGFFSPHGINAR